ncbi:hypothetical protein [Microbacterium pumilum]|uniref:Polysaccharide pyruvyl transferase domain-containing protein n=1 Tax=Microbacterium pumilum TaxID=344165 RepID=A0ABP5DPB9_9MICO
MNDRNLRPAVFVRVTGQAMNVGDSVLRRAYIDALRGMGRAHLLVRQMPEGYIDGLGVIEDDVIYRSDAEWRAAFKASARAVPTTYAFNAGEMQFSRFYTQDLAASLPMLRAAARSGGTSLMLGVSMRSKGRWSPLLTPLLRAVGRVSWRDARSRQWTGLGEVAADWAFLEGDVSASPATDADRGYLAVTLRGDRPIPGDEWFTAVTALADAKELELLAVSQVEVDTPLMREVGERLGAQLIEMPAGISHTVQEEVVRDVYRHSSIVISDRLHALVMGATEGAIPLGLADDGADKAARHFDVVGLTGVSVRTADADPALVDTTDEARGRVRVAVEMGREQLRALRAGLGATPVPQPAKA